MSPGNRLRGTCTLPASGGNRFCLPMHCSALLSIPARSGRSLQPHVSPPRGNLLLTFEEEPLLGKSSKQPRNSPFRRPKGFLSHPFSLEQLLTYLSESIFAKEVLFHILPSVLLSFFPFKSIYLCIYFWLCWVLAFSSCSERASHCGGRLLLQSTSCSAQALEGPLQHVGPRKWFATCGLCSCGIWV